MFVFLTKLSEDKDTITYQVETDINESPFGSKSGGTERVYGKFTFNKETKTFQWQEVTDPHFIGPDQSIKLAIINKLQQIQNQDFPEAFSIRE